MEKTPHAQAHCLQFFSSGQLLPSLSLCLKHNWGTLADSIHAKAVHALRLLHLHCSYENGLEGVEALHNVEESINEVFVKTSDIEHLKTRLEVLKSAK